MITTMFSMHKTLFLKYFVATIKVFTGSTKVEIHCGQLVDSLISLCRLAFLLFASAEILSIRNCKDFSTSCVHTIILKNPSYEVLYTQYLRRELGAFLEFQFHTVTML